MNIPLGSSHEPLTKLVTAALRERILNGEIPLGERLVEGRLSEELGVSRMPVREALRELAAEGIVTIEPRRGASVTTYSEEQKRELVEVRATLESLNAKLAARRHDPKQIAELQAILDEGARLMAADNPGRRRPPELPLPRGARPRRRQHRAPGHHRVAARPHGHAVRAAWRAAGAPELAGACGDPPRGDRRAMANSRRCWPPRHVYNAAQMPQQDP